MLRDPQINFDSYVMHANNYSLVTVGIFDGPNDPRMARVAERLSKLNLNSTTGSEKLTSPQPMQVPKKK